MIVGVRWFSERPIAEWLKNVKKEVAVMFTVRVSINKLYPIPKPIVVGLLGSGHGRVMSLILLCINLPVSAMSAM